MNLKSLGAKSKNFMLIYLNLIDILRILDVNEYYRRIPGAPALQDKLAL